MSNYANKNGISKTPKQYAPKKEYRFINYNLDVAQKTDLRSMDVDVEYGFPRIESLVAQGYKFSLVLDSKNASYIATLTDKAPNSEYENVSISGRGSTPGNALASVMYRHFNVADGDWSILEASENRPSGDFG